MDKHHILRNTNILKNFILKQPSESKSSEIDEFPLVVISFDHNQFWFLFVEILSW